MEGAHEVWARAVVGVVDLAIYAGVATDDLFDGLEFDDAGLRKRKRVRWDDYCTVMERIAQRVGPRFEELAEGTFHQVVPEVRALAGAMIAPKTLYRIVVGIMDPILYPPTACTYEELGGDRIHIDLRLQ